jgi:hypothetical protein
MLNDFVSHDFVKSWAGKNFQFFSSVSVNGHALSTLYRVKAENEIVAKKPGNMKTTTVTPPSIARKKFFQLFFVLCGNAQGL